jgi:protocatechuate 3,4-dioxygenase, alpha subunit
MPLPATPSQTVGPFFSFGLCQRPCSELVPPGTAGALRIAGTVSDGAGEPVPDAVLETWQADERGVFRPDFGWGRCGTDAAGRYAFVTVKPGPVDGQAPHLAVQVFARGLLRQLFTRLYFPDEVEANAADPVLRGIADDALRATLVATADGDGSLRFDVRLQGERQTAFFTL